MRAKEVRTIHKLLIYGAQLEINDAYDNKTYEYLNSIEDDDLKEQAM